MIKWKFFILVILTVFAFVQTEAQNHGARRGTAYYEETVGNLTNQIRLMQDENAKLAAAVYELQREVREMKQRMQGYQAENAELRRLIAAESDARQKQLNKIADRIHQAASQQAQAAPTQDTEEYDFYVVEPGATLSAISRATGVSIARIKQANGMKNDILRVGQKIKIPRK